MQEIDSLQLKSQISKGRKQKAQNQFCSHVLAATALSRIFLATQMDTHTVYHDLHPKVKFPLPAGHGKVTQTGSLENCFSGAIK